MKKKPQQLPEHWRRAKTEDGKIYYYNDITKGIITSVFEMFVYRVFNFAVQSTH